MLVLYRVLGVAIFGGLILMVILLPVNTWIAQKQQVLSLLVFIVQISRYEQRVLSLLALLVVLRCVCVCVKASTKAQILTQKLVRRYKY
jgi:hypothetical protein